MSHTLYHTEKIFDFVTAHLHCHVLGYGLLSYTEIESRDQSVSLCNVNMFCIVQCSRNPNLSQYPRPCNGTVNKPLV